MGPYSVDLRQRVVDAYKRGLGTIRELAEMFQVVPNTVENWLKLERETGSVAPRPHAGGVEPTIRGDVFNTLCRLAGERHDATLDELHRALEQECQIQTSEAAVCRALRRAGLSRKRRRSGRPNRTARTSRPPAATSSSGR